jgi:lipopolysaccharide biosynthesis glycosyltransferase
MENGTTHVVFLFDANYLGPALVSVMSFLEYAEMSDCSISLVYLASDPVVDARVGRSIQLFLAKAGERFPHAGLSAVVLMDTQFAGYVKRFHFSSAVLYKAALPRLFPGSSDIVFFDCGMIFGRGAGSMAERLRTRRRNGERYAVSAFCVAPDADGAFSTRAGMFPHHALYPSGGVLHFDVTLYNEARIYERFVEGYAQYRDYLHYPEQDLFCLILKEEELGQLPDDEVRCLIDMAGQEGWHELEGYRTLYRSRDFLFMKHVGSFKPWKKWVLHPAKAIYLKERHALEHLLGDAEAAALRDDEQIPKTPGYLGQQMELLENYYVRND